MCEIPVNIREGERRGWGGSILLLEFLNIQESYDNLTIYMYTYIYIVIYT